MKALGMRDRFGRLSVVLATYNEEKNLAHCLSSIVNITSEIVVVDGRSTDKTVEVAKQFGANVTVTNNPPIFHINKQKAIDQATKEWVLQIDADEMIDEELSIELLQTMKRGSLYDGYAIRRKNYFLGKWIRKGGWYPDYVIRFFRRGKGHLPCRSVHEQVIVDGQVGKLKGHLQHYSYHTMAEYWKKARLYTDLRLQEIKEIYGKKKPLALVLSPLILFFSLYIRHGLVWEGYRGFLIAFGSSVQEGRAVLRFLGM